MLNLKKRLLARNGYSLYTPQWHYHNTLLAKAVREWRLTNTLKRVK